jgi:Family of unknown function (DUF5677)
MKAPLSRGFRRSRDGYRDDGRSPLDRLCPFPALMSDDKPRERPLNEITPEMLASANRELLALVEARLPQRVYSGEGLWPLAGTALIAEMAGTVRSITTLAAEGAENDALVLLRVLYEQVVTFCWLAIDPDRNLVAWANEGHVQRLRLHNDAVRFGITLMTPEEVEVVSKRSGIPKLIDRAAAVDSYWPSLVPGFRAQPDEGPMHLLTMRGLYVGLYRIASRAAHAQVDSVDPFIDAKSPPAVVHLESKPSMMWTPLSTPLFALALLVCNHRLRWPDADTVRQINAALLHDVDPSPALDQGA